MLKAKAITIKSIVFLFCVSFIYFIPWGFIVFYNKFSKIYQTAIELITPVDSLEISENILTGYSNGIVLNYGNNKKGILQLLLDDNEIVSSEIGIEIFPAFNKGLNGN